MRESLGMDADAEPEKKFQRLLERKWTSVVRLQRKVGAAFVDLL